MSIQQNNGRARWTTSSCHSRAARRVRRVFGAYPRKDEAVESELPLSDYLIILNTSLRRQRVTKTVWNRSQPDSLATVSGSLSDCKTAIMKAYLGRHRAAISSTTGATECSLLSFEFSLLVNLAGVSTQVELF